MTATDLLKKVRKIEIKAKGLSNHIFTGSYHTAFKGRGMSFSEVRNYQYGDDVRAIDWNVTARLDEPYIKVFEEERELNIMLLIDVSRSTLFGTQSQLKKEWIAEIAAVLSFSAIKNNDKVGVIFFSDKIEKYIPPKKGKKHVLLIIRELLNVEASSNKTDINIALSFMNQVVKRRSVSFLITDFIAPDFSKQLRFTSNKHDLIGLHVYDKLEKEMPNMGLTQLFDVEKLKSEWFDFSNKKQRNEIKKQFESRQEEITHQFYRAKADFVSIHTKQDYAKELIQLFKRRSKRR